VRAEFPGNQALSGAKEKERLPFPETALLSFVSLPGEPGSRQCRGDQAMAFCRFSSTLSRKPVVDSQG
jgi:hypothetical protein